MRSERARLHENLDAIMVHVTHGQVEAMTLTDKIVVLQACSASLHPIAAAQLFGCVCTL